MFGLIQHIIAVDVENYFFVVLILHTTCFNPHFHVYEVEYPSMPEVSVVKPTDLVDHHLLGLHTMYLYFLEPMSTSGVTQISCHFKMNYV